MIYFKNYTSIILLCLFCKTGFSQNFKRINFEAGYTITKPIVQEERFVSGNISFRYDYSYKYYSSRGYFVKFAYEAKVRPRNNWSFSFPMGISFMSQTDKYYCVGSYSGCWSSGSRNDLNLINHSLINLSYGPAFQLNTCNLRFIGSALVNYCLGIHTKTNSFDYSSNKKIVSSEKSVGHNIYLSSQFCVLYRLRKNIWIGPSCEVFFNDLIKTYKNISGQINPYYDSGYLGSPSVGIRNKNIWINPGIKLQFDLK